MGAGKGRLACTKLMKSINVSVGEREVEKWREDISSKIIKHKSIGKRYSIEVVVKKSQNNYINIRQKRLQLQLLKKDKKDNR